MLNACSRCQYSFTSLVDNVPRSRFRDTENGRQQGDNLPAPCALVLQAEPIRIGEALCVYPAQPDVLVSSKGLVVTKTDGRDVNTPPTAWTTILPASRTLVPWEPLFQPSVELHSTHCYISHPMCHLAKVAGPCNTQQRVFWLFQG